MKYKVLVSILTFVAPGIVLAGPLLVNTFSPTDQGTVTLNRSFISATYSHDSADQTIAVSSVSFVSAGTTRNGFALFTLPVSTATIVGATLKLDAAVPGAPQFPDVLALWNVTAAPSAFAASFSFSGTIADSSPERDIFEDLGSGVSYADTRVLTGTNDLVLDGSSAAMSDLNAARGGVFAIGLTGFGLGFVPTTLDNLRLVVVSEVPEPGSAALALAGIFGLIVMRRRDRSGSSVELPGGDTPVATCA